MPILAPCASGLFSNNCCLFLNTNFAKPAYVQRHDWRGLIGLGGHFAVQERSGGMKMENATALRVDLEGVYYFQRCGLIASAVGDYALHRQITTG